MNTPENTESRIIRKGTAIFMTLAIAAIIFSWITIEKKRKDAIKTWESTEITQGEYRELELELETAGECPEGRIMTIKALKDRKITGSETNLIRGEISTCLEANKEERLARERADSIKNLQEIAEGKRDEKDPLQEGLGLSLELIKAFGEELEKLEREEPQQRP